MNSFTPRPPEFNPWPFLFVALIVLALYLVGCGKAGKSIGGDQPAPPPLFGAKATLVLFGAPPCSNCHRDFPAIKKVLDSYPAGDTERLAVLIVVETGTRWVDPPTQYIADQYATSLGLGGITRIPDGVKNGRPSYQLYSELTGVPHSMMALPAAAIVAKGGKVLKTFAAGGDFVPEKIVADAVGYARTSSAN